MTKKMTLVISTAFLAIFIFANFFPFLDPRGYGYYNTTFGYVVCHDRWQCLHEIGHIVDYSMDQVSLSPAYTRELGNFITVNLTVPPRARHSMIKNVVSYPGIIRPLDPISDPSTFSFWAGGWGGTVEIYAEMLVWSDGKVENMPSGFLKFYDWDLVEELLDKYVR